MNGQIDEQRAALDRLSDLLVEDIMSTPDNEILAEFRKNAGGPERLAMEMRGLFEKAANSMNEALRVTPKEADMAGLTQVVTLFHPDPVQSGQADRATLVLQKLKHLAKSVLFVGQKVLHFVRFIAHGILAEIAGLPKDAATAVPLFKTFVVGAGVTASVCVWFWFSYLVDLRFIRLHSQLSALEELNQIVHDVASIPEATNHNASDASQALRVSAQKLNDDIAIMDERIATFYKNMVKLTLDGSAEALEAELAAASRKLMNSIS